MTYVEPLRTYHTGIWQMRPALLGWQYRTRTYGLTWTAWMFRFGSEEHVRTTLQSELGEWFTEVPYDPAGAVS